MHYTKEYYQGQRSLLMVLSSGNIRSQEELKRMRGKTIDESIKASIDLVLKIRHEESIMYAKMIKEVDSQLRRFFNPRRSI